MAQDLTIQELYDGLMMEVEPELTLDAMQYINDWHQGESFLEKSVRLGHYEHCFGVVEDRMGQLLTTWEDQVKQIKNQVLASKNK